MAFADLAIDRTLSPDDHIASWDLISKSPGDLNPSLDGLLDVLLRFLARVAFADASWKGRDTGCIPPSSASSKTTL